MAWTLIHSDVFINVGSPFRAGIFTLQSEWVVKRTQGRSVKSGKVWRHPITGTYSSKGYTFDVFMKGTFLRSAMIRVKKPNFVDTVS